MWLLPYTAAFLLSSACAPGLIGEVTDLARYQTILARYGNNDLLAHFPIRIPPDAIAVDFYFAPRVFQGAEVLELQLTMSAEAFESVRSTLAPQAESAYSGPYPCFRVEAADECALPDQFELIVLRGQALGDADFSWNHGSSSGVALDPLGNRVVYWYTTW
jgi:hypothetical protein